MAERPILFSAPMVRAILAGRKTQTRRVLTVPWSKGVRCQPYEPYYVEEDGRLLVDCSEAWDSHGSGDYREASTCLRCPYGQPGDRLWVRETWAPGNQHCYDHRECCCGEYRSSSSHVQPNGYTIPSNSHPIGMHYRADGVPPPFDREEAIGSASRRAKWIPSIYMPRWASRITLEVTGVRVERVQDISHDDAEAEGVQERADEMQIGDLRVAYSGLWDILNAKLGYSWESNPWVWVVEFKAVKP